MRLTIVGCAGSYAGPDSPASSYLLEAEHDGGTYRLVMDLGSGALGALQRHVDPREVDAVVLSHLHPDHCIDLCGFFVFSKYHPTGALRPIPVWGPDETAAYMARAHGPDSSTGMGDQFDFRAWRTGEPVVLGPFTVTPVLVDHPVQAYALKVQAGDATLVYSGDTGPTEALAALADGADVLLCEASFVESQENPPNLHLTGAEAGEYARRGGVGRLLVTHVPAWTDRDEVGRDVATTFDGAWTLVEAGQVYDL